ncbi:MAG: GNAT family N-acetyltransferase [Aliarcobacter sp.]|nr:GNAT family N-acetyltransferase [Aliarcobacter sp.]
MNIIKYNIEYKNLWNEFVKTSKNRHFFFQREYMEYHCDRFEDFSLLVFDSTNKLIAILPANTKEDIVYSHQGLTFGGFLVNDKMKTETMLEIFELLEQFLKKWNIKKLVYKCIPYIYHINPSEEDRYALFRNNAKLIRRDVTTTIDLKNKIKYQEQRSRAIKKAIKNSLIFEETNDFENYWRILEETLNIQHGTKPVHSINEIKKLANLFPNNIKLFIAKDDAEILGGTLVFENEQIVHTQYLANSIKGRNMGALDFVIDKLINEVYKNKKYFDFGISNEDAGRYLNTGLIAQKEGFGARAVVHDFYELEIK